jgi:hypothetical protein
MGCLLVMMAAFAPRLGVLFIWLARPQMFDAAFDTWILPLLGIIFLPFTTLMYLIMYTPGVGLTGFDWVWLGLAVVLDVGHLGASSYNVSKETGWRSA